LPAARNTGARMPKQLAQTARVSLAFAADPGPLAMIAVAVVGLGFLVAEGAVLSTQGVHGIVYALIAVFAASTVSSIAGFAFSALCGALLFHLMDSPVYAVHVMIVCSIAIQILSVAALWRTIEWRCLRIFLIGGFLGVPAGVYLLLHLPSTTYRTVIGSLLIIYAAISCSARRHARSGWGGCQTSAPAFSAASPAGWPVFLVPSSPSGAD
jgi:uncharacterized protein